MFVSFSNQTLFYSSSIEFFHSITYLVVCIFSTLTDLEYHKEVFPIRISIYETYNPGSVVAIWARDETGQWFQLWSGPPQIVPHKPRIFSPPLQLCNFKTRMLRLEFNHSLLEYYTELDAVLLIGTSELIVPNTAFQTKNLSSILKELGGTAYNNNYDCHNLTPDYLRVNQDLRTLKNTLHKHCVLYKRYLITFIIINKKSL